jgi:hypothetical protein
VITTGGIDRSSSRISFHRFPKCFISKRRFPQKKSALRAN